MIVEHVVVCSVFSLNSVRVDRIELVVLMK
jgi:hypothetical protein